MVRNANHSAHWQVPFSALFPFLMIAFSIAWGILALFIWPTDRFIALVGKISGTHPLFFLAVYAPAIAAILLVLWHGGLRGLAAYLSRLALWRCGWSWLGFVLFGIPLIYAAGSLAKGPLWGNPFRFDSLSGMLAAMGFMLILGPVEEFGWRGLALPLLQRRMAPVWAGLILGIIWGVWHLPAFFLSGTPQGAWGFTPFFIGSISVSVILTPLFNRTGGSILWAMLFHFQLNNPLWPDAQPYDTTIFAAAAVLVVWLNRSTMFTRDAACTRVIPD